MNNAASKAMTEAFYMQRKEGATVLQQSVMLCFYRKFTETYPDTELDFEGIIEKQGDTVKASVPKLKGAMLTADQVVQAKIADDVLIEIQNKYDLFMNVRERIAVHLKEQVSHIIKQQPTWFVGNVLYNPQNRAIELIFGYK